jgi:hypothetical protein
VKPLFVLLLLSTLSFAAKVQLAWYPNPVEDKVLRYTVHYKQNDGNLDIVDTNSRFSSVSRSPDQGIDELPTTMIINHLEQGNTYYFAVKATNGEGDGPYSDVVSIRIPTDDEPPFSARKLDRFSWIVSAVGDSPPFIAKNAIDGKVGTYCHNAHASNPTAALPLSFVVQFPAVTKAQAISFLPRQDNDVAGDIKEYLLEGSRNGKEWFKIASGSFARTKSEKAVVFPEVMTNYLKFTAKSGHGGGTSGSIAIAEFNVFGTYQLPNPKTQAAKLGLKILPD